MKLCIALLIVALTGWRGVSGSFECRQADGSTKVELPSGITVGVQMPCKYNAVRQWCGAYFVTLSPGIITMGSHYRLNTLWLGLRNKNDEEWEGRTTNKKAVKFFNGNSTELFAKKDGELNTNDVLIFEKLGNATVAKDKDGSFEVIFAPWDPDRRKDGFRKSYWRFKCNKDDSVVSYPEQVCGYDKSDKKEVDDLTESQRFLYNVFMETNTSITQVDEQCKDVEDSMQKECTTETLRKEAMIACSQIIVDEKKKNGERTQKSNCINKYSCSPMHVFVDCVAWVCSNYTDDDACERMGESIDMCKELKDGNLTKKVDAAKCFKDFLAIY